MAWMVLANVSWAIPQSELVGRWPSYLLLIGLTILVEWPFVYKVAARGWRFSLLLTILSNIISGAIGFLAFELISLLLPVLPILIIQAVKYTGIDVTGQYSSIFWEYFSLLVIAIECALANTVVEGTLIVLLTIRHWNKRAFGILFVGNAITAGIAVYWITYSILG